MSEFLGRVLADKYRLDAELGRGGMGVVYRGEHTVTGRPIAIKVLRPELAEDRTLGRRFLREVKAAASLTHPNVVGVLDFGIEEDGTAFQVLELLEGESLAERLERGKLSPARALSILLPILHALDVAHARGVIHRDLKPDNVFLAENAHGRVVPKLLDFGIAKVREPERPEGARPKDTHTTQHGTVIGTPAYMSPEQARGVEVGTASDVWAMAVLLFECLSGRVPFEDENASILMAKIMLERAPSLVVVAPEVPRALALAIDAGLCPEPEGRPASMGVFRRALCEAAASAGIELPAEGVSDCAPETETRSVPPIAPIAVDEDSAPRDAVTKIDARRAPREGPAKPAAEVPAVSTRPSSTTVRTPSVAPPAQQRSSSRRGLVALAVLALAVAAGVALRASVVDGDGEEGASRAGLSIPPDRAPAPAAPSDPVPSIPVPSTPVPSTPVFVGVEPVPPLAEPPSAPRTSEVAGSHARGATHPPVEPPSEATTEPTADRTGLPGLRDWEY